jgi:hypothetical protein
MWDRNESFTEEERGKRKEGIKKKKTSTEGKAVSFTSSISRTKYLLFNCQVQQAFHPLSLLVANDFSKWKLLYVGKSLRSDNISFVKFPRK